jgi:hypothetical protein
MGATTASTNGIGGFDLFLDGVYAQSAPADGSFALDTAGMSDGWHEARVVAYEDSAIRTQGERVLHFRVDNSGQQVRPGATNLSAAVGGPAVTFDVQALGGTPSAILIRKGARLLATVSGAAGTASVSTAALGPGRSVLRAEAVMSSGVVRSAPVEVLVEEPADVLAPRLADFFVATGTNSEYKGEIRSKAAYKDGDLIFAHMRFTEPVDVTDQLVTMGSTSAPPVPLRWHGRASTNRLPGLNLTTNHVVWRYTLASASDREGLAPVAVRLTDAAGHTTVETNFIATDFTTPSVTQLWVHPHIVLPGQTVNLHSAASEPLTAAPVVRVGSGAAQFSKFENGRYTHRFVAGTTEGAYKVAFTNVYDAAENAFSTMTQEDTFEGRSVGQNLTNSSAWTAYASTGYGKTAYVTNSPTATADSTRSAVFIDFPGSNQLYSFKFPTRRTAAEIEFDVYLTDRDPGFADFRVRTSQGTTSTREIELVLRQTTASVWSLGIVAPAPINTQYYSTNLALATWHRVRYANDIVRNRYSIWLDDAPLASEVAYDGGLNVLTWVDCFNFLNNGTNEDVVLDNVRVTDSLGTVIVSGDTDADGIPDAWEKLHFGDLETATDSSDADLDGMSDRDEWRTGTDPKSDKSLLRAAVTSAAADDPNRVEILFETVPGLDYEVQSSCDLFNWTPVSTNFSDSATMRVRVAQPDTCEVWRLRPLL